MITIDCERPKRLRGQYEFDSCEGLTNWLIDAKLPQREINALIVGVAENGRYAPLVGHRVLTITGPAHGYQAKEMARQIGVINTRGKGERYSKDPQKGLEFARRIDEGVS